LVSFPFAFHEALLSAGNEREIMLAWIFDETVKELPAVADSSF